MTKIDNLRTPFSKEEWERYFILIRRNLNDKDYIKKLEKTIIDREQESDEYRNAFLISMFLFEKVIKEINDNILTFFTDNQEKVFKQLYKFYQENYYLLSIEDEEIANIMREIKSIEAVV